LKYPFYFTALFSSLLYITNWPHFQALYKTSASSSADIIFEWITRQSLPKTAFILHIGQYYRFNQQN